MLKRGHNFQNNCWILPEIELGLYFMTTYLHIKYSNTVTFSKDNERKPFSSKNLVVDLPTIDLDLYYMIIYLCIKYESNRLFFQ